MRVFTILAYFVILVYSNSGAPVETTCSTTTSPGGDYYSADTEICDVFHKCLRGVWIEQACPPGLHFDPLSNICNWPYLARCEICAVPCSPVTGRCDANNSVCTCNDGYTGDACTEEIGDDDDGDVITSTATPNVTSSQTDCSLVCLNGGICQETANGTQHCACLTGFTGSLCETFDLCYPLGCLNGATCLIQGDQASCLCAPKFSGHRCETAVQDGDDSPFISCFPACEFGGICVNATCFCPQGRSGPSCRKAESCLAEPCQNGGKCVYLEGGPGATCLCPPGFGGKFCQTESPCATVTCLNGGECREAGGGALRCHCSSGYSGNFCELKASCDDVTCQNGGQCKVVDNQPACFCLHGTTGDRCQSRSTCSQFNQENLCRNNGTCVDSEQGFVCICSFGYKGTSCHQKRKCEEDNIVCEVGASCVNTDSGAQCRYNTDQCD